MGLLVNGKWSEDDVASAAQNQNGEFRRVPVVVDGGAEIPREYWPILRAYFDRLREAKRGQALSNGTPGLQ